MLFRVILLLCAAAAASAACGCAPGFDDNSSGDQLPVPDPETGLVEGDMRLTSNNYLELMGMRNTVSNLWPGGVLYYNVRSGDSAAIKRALDRLSAATSNCVRFFRRTNQAAYVDVVNESGCWSYVGRTGRLQKLSLQSGGCYAEYIIQHEFLHALGFYHEQSRTDRDSYVNIQWGNIDSNQCHNFRKQGRLMSGHPRYDYFSVMHYGSTAFSCGGGKKTMTNKSGGNVGGRSITGTDVQKIRQLYRC